MKRNNVRLMTENELILLKKRYKFTIENNKIVVRTSIRSRETLHDIDKPFAINVKKVRKICFSQDAIQIWKSLYEEEANLLEVQQAVNKLVITFQDITLDNVKEILNGKNLKIKGVK